jgi:putative ABC transport system substrate-binding protein
VVGFVHSQLADTYGDRLRAFRQGLADTGYVEGRNVAVEYHSAEGQPDRLRALVADLIRRPAAVIVGNTVAAIAAKSA